MGFESTKAETKFLKRIKKYPESVHLALDNAEMEGFQYFASEEYTSKPGTKAPNMKNKFIQLGLGNSVNLMKMMLSIMPKMLKGINESYSDAEEELKLLESGKDIISADHKFLQTYPNTDLWNELTTYAWDKWKVIIGFTELPEELIFKGKGVMYKHSLVCIQEMSKDSIDQAPEFEAGREVMRRYASLGLAANDIANWLRDNQEVKCHANHPLGGLVNSVPLAVKAGMGYFGHNGLLITREFGQRQRIAPIFIEGKFFEYTDSDEHNWIAEFCNSCRKCERNCPTKAITHDKVIKDFEIDGIGKLKTSIDQEKCFPYFNKTMGCSVCIKVCPFSEADGMYERLKEATINRIKQKDRN